MFKDTGEMVGDIRGGFRAGAPIAAAAGMVGITIFIELVKTAFLSWRAMLFWKLLASAILIIIPLHIALFYGFPLAPEPKLTMTDWILGELIIYFNLSISIFYYAKRYRIIEKEFGLDVDNLHKEMVIDGLIRGIAIFLTFLVIFVPILWVISLFPWFKGGVKGGWWVLGSDKSMSVCFNWFIFSLFCMWVYCIYNFKTYAVAYINENAKISEGETEEHFFTRKQTCISSLDWSWKGVRKLLVFQIKLILWLVVVAIVTFLALYITKKLGIWH